MLMNLQLEKVNQAVYLFPLSIRLRLLYIVLKYMNYFEEDRSYLCSSLPTRGHRQHGFRRRWIRD